MRPDADPDFFALVRAAEAAYDAYRTHLGGTPPDTRAWPAWDDIPERQREAWIAAVSAVEQALRPE